MSSTHRKRCEGCAGHGKYVGLNVVEDPCETCGGCGWRDSRWERVSTWRLNPGQTLVRMTSQPWGISAMQAAAEAAGWSGRNSNVNRYDRVLAALERLRDLTVNMPEVTDLVVVSPPVDGQPEDRGVLSATKGRYVFFDDVEKNSVDDARRISVAIVCDLNPLSPKWTAIENTATALGGFWTKPSPVPDTPDCKCIVGRTWIGAELRIGS